MTFTTYKQWRAELTAIQTKIDEFDEAFYEKLDSIPVADQEKAEADFMNDRQVLVDELVAHYKQEARFI